MTEWRESSREEIQTYYQNEFPEYIPRIPEHITANDPYEFAVALRKKHPLTGSSLDTDFIRRHTREKSPSKDVDWGDAIFTNNTNTPDFDTVLDFIRNPASSDPRHRTQPENALVSTTDSDMSEPVAEAVYYRLMNHSVGWVFLFDIDAKDVAAESFRDDFDSQTGRDTILEESGVYDVDPVGFPYRYEDVEQAIEYAFELADFARDGLGKEKILPVYSGQGAHLYILDEDVRQYTRQTREGIKNMVLYGEDLKIPIDPVVTQTPDRLARLPYSLHTDVSRICMPISSPDFDFRSKATPDFID